MKALVSVLAATALIGAAAPRNTGDSNAAAQPKAEAAGPGVDMATLKTQVILAKLGFSPGVLDGKKGQSLTLALKGFQTSRGLKPTGTMDEPTTQALAPYQGVEAVKRLRLDEASLAGPYTNPFPKDPKQQALLPALDYRNALEALAERFHTTPAVLIALNSPTTMLRVGEIVTFPNALPSSREYTISDEAARTRLASLNVDATEPQAARIVVDKSDGALKVYDADDRLVAQFPATMGSERDPLPLGTWELKGTSFNPTWNYNPAILKTADKSDPELQIKAGPNNPVGVVWIDLSKEHYGIHGTAEPSVIGRAESNGCIRLTNWDAARLALMVKPGLKAVFQA